jgi:hypothetical protein
VNDALLERYPRLARLFAAYVNQDWDVHGETPYGAVRAYASATKAAERKEAVAEIARLLAEFRGEKALDAALGDSSAATPSADGTTAKAFLGRVKRLLVAAPRNRA